MFSSNTPESLERPINENKITFPQPKTGDVKILILPIISYTESKSQDFSRIIADRLSGLTEKHKLNTQINYLQDFTYPSDFNQSIRDSILKVHSADFMIWGNYASEKGKDFVALKYYSYRWIYVKKVDLSLKETSVIEFSDGANQLDIDYLIYNITARTRYIRYCKALQNDLSGNKSDLYYAINLFKHCFILDSSISTKDESYIALGTCYMLVDSFSRAIECFNKELRIVRQDYTIINLTAAYVAIHDYKNAMKVINTIPFSNSNPLLLSQRAFINHSINNQEAALRDNSTAITLNNNIPYFFQQRSWIYQKLYQTNHQVAFLDSAIRSISHAIQILPGNIQYYRERAILFDKAGLTNELIADYSRIISSTSATDVEYNARSAAYTEKNQFDLAILDLQMAIKKNPNEDMYYYNLGINYLKKNEVAKGLEYFKMALKLDQNNVDALYNKAICEYAFKNFVQAKNDLSRYASIVKNQKPPDYYRLVDSTNYYLGQSLERKGQ